MRSVHVGWGMGVAYRWILVALTGALLGPAAAQPSCAPGTAPSTPLAPSAQAQGSCCSIASVDTKPALGVSQPAQGSSGGGVGSGSADSQWLAYVQVLDGLTYRPRPGLTIYGKAEGTCPSAWAWCKGNFYANLVGHTDANGQAVLAIPAFVRPCQDNHGHQFNVKCMLSDIKVTGVANKDQWGWDVLVLPGMSFGDEVDSGGMVTFSSVTPKPERKDLSDPHYGGASQPNTSVLLTWKGGASLDHPVVIVPDMDAANEETSTMTLVATRKLAGALLRQGFTVSIGNFADSSQPITGFDTEISNWIQQANAMTGKKVQVIGVGVGGLLVRQALAHNSTALASTSAWYSLDAPHKGLNFGRGEDSRLVFRCGGYGKEVWRRYTRVTPNPLVANPLDFNAPQCSCGRNVNPNDETIGKDPSQWTCVSSSQAHDSFFSALGWPPQNVPHFAVSYGDVYNHALMGTDGNLIKVSFTLNVNCPYFGKNIAGWKRDCVAGSGYLTEADVNNESDVQGFVVLGTSLNAGLCGKRKIELDYQPAFVNIDSALAADSEPVPTAGRSDCGYDYSRPMDQMTVTHWTDWAGNASNWDHRVLSDYLACKLLGWMNNIDHGAALPDCGPPPTVVVSTQ